MTNVFETLKERGFIEQCTHEEEIKELLRKEKVTFYTGYDATADSLTAGHFLTVMAAAHMQRAGHVPIILIGGGTTMVGDPTGKTDMRKMLTLEQINHNAECFKRQLSKFIDFSDNKAIMINNAEWLLELNYVSLLREVGVHFSVNRMLTFDCYKSRMEKGLSFLEFNYMIMQSYDFLELNRRFGCKLQTGGNDQWSNILGGVELIRRKEQKEAFGLTFTLLTTSEGKKMGKTEKGAVWLDPNKTSPFEFYQYWRNVNDVDVIKCLKLLTFVPINQINELSKLKDQEINNAKKVLAYEITKIVHGEEEARKAQQAAEALFSTGGPAGEMPTTEISSKDIIEGINILELLVITKLAPSKGEARRLVSQGGISIDGSRIEEISHMVTDKDFNNNEILIKKGKKVFHKVIII